MTPFSMRLPFVRARVSMAAPRSQRGQHAQHLSKLGIRKPNAGMSFTLLYCSRAF